jgi:crotonyl-CoA carboxylase/reductase
MIKTRLVDLGSLPELGDVPELMYAQVIRSDRLGDPRTAFAIEQVPVPELGPRDVLIAVMAAGINYNNVWAARGIPVDVIAQRQRGGDPYNFHIGGSDAAGIVWAVGRDVQSLQVGQPVVTHPGYWDAGDPSASSDPMLEASARIWGYDTNFGSFAQFARAQDHQVMPKASRLTWEEAAAPGLVGTTAYRMLYGWDGNQLKSDDIVLVWGGAGGLGSQAVQIVADAGARAVAVISDPEQEEFCRRLGAAGVINRLDYSHWGVAPPWTDAAGQSSWTRQARKFGSAIWDIVGSRRNPTIVFEHPGQDTLATSLFVCSRGGMVVICAGTTGYSPVMDLRHLWVSQKRVQGSHGTNDGQANAYNDLVRAGRIDPCLGEVLKFDQIPQAHYDMGEGRHARGNAVALVGASSPGLGRG